MLPLSTILRAAALTILCAAALAAQSDTWTRLQSIRPAQTAHVFLDDGTRHAGAFVSATDDAVVIRKSGREQSFPKTLVKRVRVRSRSKRWRNAGIGAAIGMAAAAPILADDFFGTPTVYAITAGVLGIVGATAGAFIPGYDTIYRRP